MPQIRLYNSDCIEAMKKNIKDHTIDLIVTDPPYNLGNFMKNRDTNLSKMRDNFFGSAGWDDMEFEEWEKSMDAFFKSSARVMKKGGTMIVFMAIIKVETISMDDDMQTNPKELVKMFAAFDEGYDVVYGYYMEKKENYVLYL